MGNANFAKFHGAQKFLGLQYVVYTMEPLSKKDTTETRTPLYEGSLKEQLYNHAYFTSSLEFCEEMWNTLRTIVEFQ